MRMEKEASFQIIPTRFAHHEDPGVARYSALRSRTDDAARSPL